MPAPARVAPPRGAVPARTPDAVSDSFLADMLAGAGIDRSVVTPELAREFGKIMRVVVAGVIDVLQARQRLKDEVRFPQRNNTYSSAEMLLALLYPIILGLERIETTELLQHNGVFQTLTGLPTYPDPTSLRRFLRRFAVRGLPRLRRLHDRLLAKMCQRSRPLRRVLLDLDSTVLTLYGHQEKARRGYNPRKRGRPSYHPLVCFEAQTRDFWHGELRPGDIHTATGAVWLLRACMAKVHGTSSRTIAVSRFTSTNRVRD